MSEHALSVAQGRRFEFGKNWTRFLTVLDENRIAEAVKSLQQMLDVNDLTGKSFLDIGSGSGLFSLAARRLGAHVHSFDYDPQSVACTTELRRRYCPEDPDWYVGEGSILDADYTKGQGAFDVVYSWGVLHHTGAMWQALENASLPVKPGGQLFIAIYNDQGWESRAWKAVKRTYNAMPQALKFLVLWPAFVRLWGPTTIRDIVRGKPFHSWRNYGDVRGMSAWHNVVDWVGGYPFDVATPDAVEDFYRQRGFVLHTLRTCGRGLGCNEFVFQRGDASRPERR